MALTVEELNEMATLAAEVGDEQAELQALEQLDASGAFGSSTARAEGQSIGSTLIGGANLLAAGVAGAGEQVIEGLSELGGVISGRGTEKSIQSAKALTEAIPDVPLGEDAQALVQNISERFNASPQVAQDIFNFVAHNISALPETAGDIGKKIGDPIGLGSTLGAGFSAIPAALEFGAGIKGAKTVAGAIPSVVEAAETAKVAVPALFKRQSATKQKIAQLIKQGSTDDITAQFKLEKPKAGVVEPDVTIRAPDTPLLGSPEEILQQAEKQARQAKTAERLKKTLNIGGPRVVKDPLAIEAVTQGFDEGVIAPIKAATKGTKSDALQMVNIAENISNNKLFGMRNRPSDVTGDLLMSRLNVVRQANRNAAKKLDSTAKSLKGKRFDASSATDSFVDSLDAMGIKLARGPEGSVELDFKGSDIEGLSGPEAVLNRVVKRMSGTKAPDAFEAHKLKRFIDEHVTFGKNAEGLAGRAELSLKKLRRDIDKQLDDNFPDYNEVNTQFAETIGVLDRFQDVAGRKMNLTGDNAEKATGTLMRRLMGNAQSRIRLLDSIDEIEEAAGKFGGKLGEKLLIEGKVEKGLEKDLLTQVLFADELDSVFGPAARTSLQGEFDSVMKRTLRSTASRGGIVDIAVDVAGEVAERAKGINKEGAFKAIKELLKESE